MNSELLDLAKAGDKGSLARLISWVERDPDQSLDIVPISYPFVLGVTGAPGAGKSTLVSRLIPAVRTEGRRVAVIAVDPSSPFTQGAILGDRVRMQEHSGDPGVYIRSLASRGAGGGLSDAVPAVLRLLGACDFDLVILETVGVGQVELDVVSLADIVLVVITPGWGDSIQANKAGLMEIADIFAINKADSGPVRQTRRDLEQMLMLGNRLDKVAVVETVATDGAGIAELGAEIQRLRKNLDDTAGWQAKTEARLARELKGVVSRRVRAVLESSQADDIVMEVVNGGVPLASGVSMISELVKREI
jgi:LAO/AO transport system kinase